MCCGTGFHGSTICIQWKCSPSPKSTPRVKVTLGIAAAPSSAAFGELIVQHGDLPVPGSVAGHSYTGCSHPSSVLTEIFAFGAPSFRTRGFASGHLSLSSGFHHCLVLCCSVPRSCCDAIWVIPAPDSRQRFLWLLSQGFTVTLLLAGHHLLHLGLLAFKNQAIPAAVGFNTRKSCCSLRQPVIFPDFKGNMGISLPPQGPNPQDRFPGAGS